MTPAELAASKERANRKRQLHRLWAGDSSLDEICDDLGMAEDEVLEFAQSLGLPPRPEPEFFLPTPEQIRMACAEIRSKWTQLERESRRAAAWSVRMDNATGSDTNDLRSPSDHRD
jgi:hypothetical protein